MIWRWMAALFKWVLALGLIGGLFYLAFWVHAEMQAERAREGDEEKVQSPLRAKDGIVRLGVGDVPRCGLEEEPARAISWSERVPVYGQVIPNPKATVAVRSPFAGTLRAGGDAAWPAPGQWVRSGRILGWVDLRVSAQERLTLLDNLNNARLKKQGAERVVALQRERVNRIEKVSRSQIVPGQQLDDAKVLLADAETQLAIATAAVALWQKALDEVDRPGDRLTSTYSQPLTAPADGEVTELAAQPGMAIEAGGLVAQVVDFRRPLIRLDLPPQLLRDGPAPRLGVFAIPAHPAIRMGVADLAQPAEPAPMLEVALAGPAPQVDRASQYVGYWYTPDPVPRRSETQQAPFRRSGLSLTPGGPGPVWRPGLWVKAYWKSPSAGAQPAVSIPVAAVLFHQGRSLVYVRTKPGEYQRREVRLLGRQGDSWVLAPRHGSVVSGLAPGEVVVRRGAQVLLSEEFRSDVEAD